MEAKAFACGYKKKYHTKTDRRPTFQVTIGDHKEDIRAGGALFYKRDTATRDLLFLMIKKDGAYEDFGGKTDEVDKTILETIAREVDEESNHIFKKEEILRRLNTPCTSRDWVYSKGGKYLVHFIELTEEESRIDPAEFGCEEIHDGIQRTVEYVRFTAKNQFGDIDLHCRLTCKHFEIKCRQLCSLTQKSPQSAPDSKKTTTAVTSHASHASHTEDKLLEAMSSLHLHT